jgi:hypothetical protein
LTQQGFCPRCGKHASLHELQKGDGIYKRSRFRKGYEKVELYCEGCIDRIKNQEAIDRKHAAIRRYEQDRKYGRAHHV